MSLLIQPGTSGRIEVDTADLSGDEWLVVLALKGEQSNAPLDKKIELREMRKRLTTEQIWQKLNAGIQKLLERGYLTYETDDEGNQVMTTHPDGSKTPNYVTSGVLITRMKTLGGPRTPAA